MIFSSFFKYWLIYTITLAYVFTTKNFPNVIPWETPTHIFVLITVILGVGSLFFVLMILSCLSEEMMSRSESFGFFGNKKIWRIWQYPGLGMLVWSFYTWEHIGVLLASFCFYFGLKCMISNQNKHVESFNNEEMVRKARQETAEKVTL